MNIQSSSRKSPRTRQRGMATVVILVLLGMVLTFIFANLAALAHLHGEIKLIERSQLRRLNHTSTNAVPISASSPVRRQ